MKRWYLIVAGVLVLAAIAAVVALTYDPKVEVRAGERIECTYGHLVSEDIKTISVPKSEASQYGVKTTRIVCDDHKRAEQLYREAQEAIAKDDLKTAEEKLTEVVAVYPDFGNAQNQLLDIAEGKKPAADSSGGNTGGTDAEEPSQPGEPSTPGDDEPVGPVASLAGWTPDNIDGYDADRIISDVLSLSREYTPASGNRVELLTIAAEQMISADAAEQKIDQELKLQYDKNNKPLKINGRDAWRGTNGNDVAVLAVVDKQVLVVLQARSSRTDPADLVGDLVEIAETLPR